MLRAMQTAAPLAAALGLRPLVRPDCVERCAFFTVDANGQQVAQPGPTSGAVLRSFPTYDISQLSSTALPTLETVADARVRAAKVAGELQLQAASGVAVELLVLVAHADFIGLLSRALLGGSSTVTTADESVQSAQTS